MESSYECDTLIFCRLLGFAVNSFDGPPNIGAVGPVVYALDEFSPLSYLVIRCRSGDLIIHCRQPGRGPSCVGRLAPPSWIGFQLGLVACIASVFQWGYDGKQHSIVSPVTTSRLSGNQLEDDGSSAYILSIVISGPVILLQVAVGSVPSGS